MSDNNKFPASFTQEQFVPFLTEDEIQTITASLAHTISKKFQGEELVLIGQLKGSCIFMADLMRKLQNVKVSIDFIKVGSVGRTKESSGTIFLSKDISSNIENKNVLIVEEIIDTGRALKFIQDRLKLSNPRSIGIVALLDKPYKRAVPIKPDYIGKQIEDQFTVGYGLDLDQFGRNFSSIFYLKYPN